MAGEFTPENLERTRLWQRLQGPFGGDEAGKLARSLSQSLLVVCQMAADRMKAMPVLHGEFTLHDETHLLRVTELMAKVIPENVLEGVLNPVEIALLILAAHFHDIGMVPEADDVTQIRASGEYLLARQNWIIEYPTFKEALRVLNDAEANASDRERAKVILSDFEDAVFARLVRETHAERSAEYVKLRLGNDDHLRVGGGHLSDSLGLLCVSHNWPPDSITTAAGFYCDKAIGTYPVNLPYLAMILRLADILDFDRERTPAELFRCINFTNPVSIQEWEKHRQVEGWKIDRDAVRFECTCERPEYEQAIRRFLRMIDDELAAAHDIVRRFPNSASQYVLDLPARTDSSRVQPRAGAYRYAADLEISLSRDEIVRLLMTEKLYGHASLAIRELLQNAFDALRYRRAIVMRDEEMEWNLGKVEFEHGVNGQGREFVRCTDNGAGMDERIVKEYLVRAGRSYYHSPEFERERLTFLKAKSDFDPCARFGIGFMSLFMLGDQITILTRRYRGSSSGNGEPLIVEINSIGGLIVLRRGADDQAVGTCVTVVGRRKPERFSMGKDRVQLTDTLYTYDVAGEFPVHGVCSIPEIKDEVSISPEMAKPWHPLTKYDINNREMFSQSFSEVDSHLRGEIICGVQVTDQGNLAVSTEEAGWQNYAPNHGPRFWIANGQQHEVFLWEGRTCIDGILVAGPHGRGFGDHFISGTTYRNPIGFGQDMFVLDVRGDLKPELKPDRSPPTGLGVIFDDEGPSWRKLRRIVAKAHVRLWEKVIERFNRSTDAKALWQLVALHRAEVSLMRRGFVWEKLLVPSLRRDNNELFFRSFSQLPSIPFGVGTHFPFAVEDGGDRIGLDEEMASWDQGKPDGMVASALRDAVVSMGTITFSGGRLVLEFLPPINPDELGFTNVILDRWSKHIPALSFGSGLEGVLAVEASSRVINRRHPLVDYLIAKQESVVDEPEFSFLHTLAGALVEEGALRALATNDFANRRFNWHFSLLGYYFRNIDPGKLPKGLAPPYRCWIPASGFFEVTEATLKALADIQLIDWVKDQRLRRE